jgi:hypothetical protein
MARARTRTVMLAKFFEEYDRKKGTNWMDLIAFDDDEFIIVVPVGTLPRQLVEAVYEAYGRPEPWDEALREEQKRLRRERDTQAIVDWKLRAEDLGGYGEYYPVPRRESGDAVWEAMPPDLETAIDTAVLFAYDTREDKLERLGEGNGSHALSKDEVTTVS